MSLDFSNFDIDFEKIYKHRIAQTANDLTALNGLRKKYIAAGAVFAVFALLTISGGLLNFYPYVKKFKAPFYLALFLAFFLGVAIYIYIPRLFNRKLKQELTPMLRLFFPGNSLQYCGISIKERTIPFMTYLLVAVLVLIIGLGVAIYYEFVFFTLVETILAFTVLVFALVAICLSNRKMIDHKNKNFLEKLFSNTDTLPKNQQLTIFDLARLFYPTQEKIVREESFMGTHKGCSFEAVDIECIRFEGDHRRAVRVFRGIVIKINPKRINKNPVIIINKLLHGPSLLSSFKLITTNNDEFSKNFDIYCQSQNIDRVFSPKIKEDILMTAANYPICQIAILANGVYVFIPHDDPFELNLSILKKIDKRALQRGLERVVREIYMTFKIIELFSENN